MRVAVVINASAGSLVGRKGAAEEVAEAMRAQGIETHIEPDDGRKLPDRILAAVERGADAVVVGGGDGTIACAAQQLVGTGVALGIIPLGTMNLLAKDLHIPLDTDAAIQSLATGVVREIDAGMVNGHVFLCNSVLGMASRLAERRERMRGAKGRTKELWSMGISALRWYWRYPPLTVSIDSGQGPRRIRSRVIAVVNNDYDETFGEVMTRSTLDGGELVLYVMHGLTLMGTAKFAAGMLLGRWRDNQQLERHALPGLSIHSARKTLRVMNDGETYLLRPPLRYSIRPGAMRVIVPADSKVGSAPKDGLSEMAA